MLAQRRELLRELPPHRHRERGRDADVVQSTAVVVQPEQQGSDQLVLSGLVPPKSGDDAVCGSCVLHFDHRALARLVHAVLGLRDDAVEAGAFEARQPFGGNRRIARHRRDVDRRLDAGERLLEQRAPLALRRLAQVAAGSRKQIEGDERRRRVFRELRHARSRRMQAELQRIEIQPARGDDDDLAIDDASVRQANQQ